MTCRTSRIMLGPVATSRRSSLLRRRSSKLFLIRQQKPLIFVVIVALLLLLLATTALGAEAAAREEEDLYKLLGVTETATTREIKRAYRQKALETHPDKNPNVDPEKAAEAFHKVVHAFEILSDDQSRKTYDRTGQSNPQQQQQQQQQYRQWSWSWNSGGGQRYNNYRQRKFGEQPKVKEAQARILHIVSMEQLETIMVDDAGGSAAGDGTLERNLLLCFVTPQLESHLMEEMGYPFPFAGMSDQGIWWEDLMQTTQVRFHRANNLTRFFGIPSGDDLKAPVFVFGRRGQLFHDKSHWTRIQTNNRHEYDQWVWKQVETNIEFVNKHNHPVEVYWINGNSGKIKMKLQPGERTSHTTRLSHEWFVRDVRTDARSDSPGRHKLSENSALAKWKVVSDTRTTYTVPLRTCYDLSGHCSWWYAQGECNKNPNFMAETCPLTCKLCESDAREEEDDLRMTLEEEDESEDYHQYMPDDAADAAPDSKPQSGHEKHSGHDESTEERTPNGTCDNKDGDNTCEATHDEL